MNDPKEPREWADTSDYPQDGWGNLIVDRDVKKDEDEEDIPDENDEDVL